MPHLKSTLIFISIILFSSNVVAGMFLPVNQPEYEFLYDAAKRDEVKGGFYHYNYNTGPYDFAEVYEYPQILSAGEDIPDNHIRAFGFLSEDYRTADDISGRGYELIRVGAAGQPIKNITFYVNMLLDEELAEDPAYGGKVWRGLAGEVENATISFHNSDFEIVMGRFGSFWGPGRESLILSPSARPMDGAQFRLHWGRLHYSFQIAGLSRYINPADTSRIFYNRYFSGHRIDFRLFDNLNIALFETVIYGGPGRSLKLAYLNPLLFFHSYQLNENIDDNTFLGLDITWYLENRYKLYGQLMVDDFQVDDAVQSDQEPDEIGILAGFYGVDIFNWLDIRAEYVRITNRTYNQNKAWNRYDNRGELIGHPFGPDGEKIDLVLEKWVKPSLRAGINLTYERKGEGRYDDPWTTPWLDVEGDYSEPFPTGTVEKSYGASLRLTGICRKLIFFDIEGGFSDVQNYMYAENDDRTIGFFNLKLSLILSGLIDLD